MSALLLNLVRRRHTVCAGRSKFRSAQTHCLRWSKVRLCSQGLLLVLHSYWILVRMCLKVWYFGLFRVPHFINFSADTLSALVDLNLDQRRHTVCADRKYGCARKVCCSYFIRIGFWYGYVRKSGTFVVHSSTIFSADSVSALSTWSKLQSGAPTFSTSRTSTESTCWCWSKHPGRTLYSKILPVQLKQYE